MLKAVLFDLDGTLLTLDIETFLPRYVKSISRKAQHKIPNNIFQKALFAGTEEMVKNVQKDKSNQEVFMETFFSLVNIDKKEILPMLDEFYKNDFSNLQSDITAVPGAKEAVKFCKDNGLKVVLATNPVFPKEATYERIRWAGLNATDFNLITSYENMSATKPNLEYYQQILDKLGIRGKEAMMVGNDCQEDLCAAKLGMKTFLVDDGLVIDRSGGNYTVDLKGSLKEFPDKIRPLI
ncbi:HAD family hydrolase [Proteinivorax hydrogeniformans]|uniref:HAD family hydrolase n=1 Tax=Proteinivorax hydrogeniformans TaxID=1826727 RepID=A0AAU8HVZ5_9FIRM